MLTIIYASAICACIAFWRAWRRKVDGISIGSFGRGALVCAYWLLALTLLGGLVASLQIQNDDLSEAQFGILFGLAIVTMLQVALFTFVMIPVAMHGKSKKIYSFKQSLILMGASAAVSIIMLAAALTYAMHYRESLLHLAPH